MTFRQFAFNNVKRNFRQYLSYFFSCMFSVAVFFIYAVIMFHPEMEGHTFRQTVQRGITAVEIIIFVFSFLFILYSTGAFVKSRKHEYAILMTLGIGKGQLNRLLILENTIIGLVSIIAGLLVGTLFANIFIMGFSNLLDLEESLGFVIAWKALALTVAGYFVMFEINSILVVWTLRLNSIVSLFKGARGPKKTPKFSWILSIIGLALVIAAYYLAATANLITIFERMFIILALIVPGTYLLYTQFSVLLIHLLKKNKTLYLKKTNLLTISDLGYKLKDHARLLFFVTILSAVAFTASGVIYGIYQSAETEASAYIPQDASFLSKGEENIAQMDQEVKKITDGLKQEDISFQTLIVDRTQAQTMIDGEQVWIDLLAYSDYRALAELQGESVIQLGNDEAMLLQYHYMTAVAPFNQDQLTIESEEAKVTLQARAAAKSILNPNFQTTYTVVVPDRTFSEFAAVAQPNEHYRYVALFIDNWTSNAEMITEKLALADTDITVTHSTADQYLMFRDSFSYALFFGLFVSVLFFLAAGSILYFKLYQDLDKDIQRYQSLYRIGLTVKEMKQSATRQIGYLFFTPFVFAVVHAGFAFWALQNMLESSILLPSILLISCYLAIYVIYFFFVRGLYINKIKQVM
ncbi:ABC transporter permease [Gracilibacillus caseinilyticus]|uniref:ABC transporter permease n=1 Tax=Gracilibacillus caseinilyticus TaxID=2932256 RepID=A0ABY4EWN3_9BACI|nr:FtsX-like permease family protein [Gracilibacillus caseinilyticus]UOQ48819.1 ABC transporter permease [Gracilibacillus caseinilyticus]